MISFSDGIIEAVAACAAGSGDYRCNGAINAQAAGMDAIKQHYHEIALEDMTTSWPHYSGICEDEPFIFKNNKAAWYLANRVKD